MTTMSLSGSDWAVGAATGSAREVEEWLPATVPGDVHTALLAAGRIHDPFLALDAERCRWVETVDWWFKKDFALESLAGRRAHLIFEGVDYSADVYLNDTLLGRHEGMFSRQIYEVTQALRPRNTLAVRLRAAASLPKPRLSRRQTLAKKVAKKLFWTDLFPDRLATLKCQMSFGWDFAPRLLTSGLWDEVHLHLSDTVFISDVFVSSSVDAEGATVRLRVELDSAAEVECDLITRVEGGNFDCPGLVFCRSTSLPRGQMQRDFDFRLAAPRPWQPWDRGRPNLYRLRLEVRRKGRLLDERDTTFGIRSVALAANPGAPAGSANLTLMVNGQREFMRGANWVPADSLFARVSTADYAELLSLAKAAHVNMLRVWGGGLREKRAFYELCDAEGILVWQEFPLACAFFDHYPTDSTFVRLVEREAKGIVRHLRNHPSLALWCGGNEFAPARNRRAVDAIRTAVASLDGTRPFLPSSPGKGDGHNWRIWHGKASLQDYLKDASILASEFGLQAAPAVSSLQRFLSPEALYPPGEQWEYHGAQLNKLKLYAARFALRDLASFVAATQRSQALGLQTAIEHFRRSKGRTSGVLFWQFNEPWPAICWSVVDFFRQPKLAYEKLKEIYNPVLISLSFASGKYLPGDMVAAEVWAINDFRESLDNCELLLRVDQAIVYRRKLSLPPDSCHLVDKAEIAVGDSYELEVELAREGKTISRNRYDLSYLDDIRMSRVDAVRHWVAWKSIQ